jgi:hypothetical protein
MCFPGSCRWAEETKKASVSDLLSVQLFPSNGSLIIESTTCCGSCKDCTCGLKELEDEEFGTSSTPAFYIEGEDDIPDVIKNATAGVEKIWPKGDKLETAVKTSSCGSCYAGDAFRCGSCPYLGLPAFEPGQKIEIPIAMNDL